MSTKVKIYGDARTINPSPKTEGQEIKPVYDSVGREVVIPYQVRGLMDTAYASTATLAEVTLLAGEASQFHDLVEITCANTSTAAVLISLRNTTAGSVIKSLQIPASDTRSFTFPVPVPTAEYGQSWTIQNAGSGDISGTVVNVSAIFVDNV